MCSGFFFSFETVSDIYVHVRLCGYVRRYMPPDDAIHISCTADLLEPFGVSSPLSIFNY